MVDELDAASAARTARASTTTRETGQEVAWPGLKTFYPQKKADDVDVEVLKQRLPRHHRDWKPPAPSRKASSPIRAKPTSAPSSASASRPIPAGCSAYIDGMGAKAFVALCEKLAAAYGAHFKPTALLKDMAAKGETFYGRFDPLREGEGGGVKTASGHHAVA